MFFLPCHLVNQPSGSAWSSPWSNQHHSARKWVPNTQNPRWFFSVLAFFWGLSTKKNKLPSRVTKKGRTPQKEILQHPSGIAISKKKSMTSPSLGTLSCQLRFIGRGLRYTPHRAGFRWSVDLFAIFKQPRKSTFKSAWKNHGKTSRRLPLRATNNASQAENLLLLVLVALTWDCKRW